MIIAFHTLKAEHGNFLLIGTEQQAKDFCKPYIEKGGTAEYWIYLGTHYLEQHIVKEFDKVIIL